MRITRVRVRDFRVHRDLDLELAPGLTVIRGPNQAGTTTLPGAREGGREAERAGRVRIRAGRKGDADQTMHGR